MNKRFYPHILIVVGALLFSFLLEAPTRTVYASGFSGDSLHVLTSADSLKALKQLQADINAIIKKYNLNTSYCGILVRKLPSDRPIFEYNASLPLTPASTTKLVTTFTALRELGSDYSISTILTAAVKPSGDVLKSDLYIKGFGDPYFTVSDIDMLADQLRNAGVKRVEGNIVGDASFMDDKYQRIQYSGDNEVVEPTPPICALSVNHNQFTVIVSSPREPGLPLNVQTFPRSSGFEIVNTALSVGRAKPIAKPKPVKSPKKESKKPANSKKQSSQAKKPSAKASKKGKRHSSRYSVPMYQQYGDASVDIPRYDPIGESHKDSKDNGGLQVTVSGSPDEKQIITVSGTLTANKTVSYKFQMRNPALIIAGIVYDRLLSRGIEITGRPFYGQAPARRVVLATVNRSLLAMLTTLMKRSDNYLAECTFKMIGGKNGGLPETANLSRQAIYRQMATCRIPFNDCMLNDGSGLSRRNKLTVAALCGILSSAYRDKKLFPALYSTMSIAGVDGTLRKRMRGTYAQGNVHGKTGTLNNVSALTGYVTTRDGELWTFGMLMNGGGGYHPPQDQIAEKLAAFSYRNGITPDSTVSSVVPTVKTPASGRK